MISAPLWICFVEPEPPQVLHLERTEIGRGIVRTQIVVNDDAPAVVGPGFLIEYQHRVVVGDGYRLPLEKTECRLIVPVDPSVIVFPCAVLFGTNCVESLVQIEG